jgi:hypothetical protein
MRRISESERRRAAKRSPRGRIGQQVLILGAIFKQSRGRAARTVAELQAWATSPQGQTALTPYLNSDGKIDLDVVADQRRNRTKAARAARAAKLAENSEFPTKISVGESKKS